jgi:hypothetical protein
MEMLNESLLSLRLPLSSLRRRLFRMRRRSNVFEVDAQPRTESKPVTAVRRTAIHLKRLRGLKPAGFRLLSLIAVYFCLSSRYARAQSMPHEQ